MRYMEGLVTLFSVTEDDRTTPEYTDPDGRRGHAQINEEILIIWRISV